MSASDPADAFEPTRQIQPEALRPKTAPAAEDPMIGREVIGQYRIEKKIGAGGMGAVYLARQTSVSRSAVIKVLRPQLGGSLDGTARFAVEAKAASALNHPNIVTIYNYGEMEDGTLFLAMEYIDGETLAERLERCGKLPVDQAVHIATQIARAIGEAHAHGVIHRDLKPQNVMLVARGGEPDFVKVLDFGIAKLDDAGVTSTGYVVGTPRYMSPEQLLGKKLDGRSDIYSAGVMLYEMLAGTTPFQSESPMGWLHQHLKVEPRPPSSLAKGSKIPAHVESVVLRALAKAPDDRPRSMEMFALDLAAALNAPTEPPPPPWWTRAAARLAQVTVAILSTLASGAWKAARTIGAVSQRLGCAVGSGASTLLRSTASGTRRVALAIGSVAWSGLRAIATWPGRGVRAIGSGMRRSLGALVFVAQRSRRAISAVHQRQRAKRAAVPSTPRTVHPLARSGSPRRSLACLPIAHRMLIALAVIVACAALLVALSPKVRADFGLGGNDEEASAKPSGGKPKRAQVPTSAPARDKDRDKYRDKAR